MADATPPPPLPTGGTPSSNRGVMIVLSYLWLLALVPLLVEKDDKEVQWHAKHGIVLMIAEIVFWIAVTIVQMALGTILGCVVGLIAPWNFPWAIPVWKSAPALVAGNTVIFKPSELTPATATLMTEIYAEAGAPPGVFNMLVGNGKLGKSLADTLGANSVALMRGHGAVVVAPALPLLVFRAVYTDQNARMQSQAIALGGPITFLDNDEAAQASKVIDQIHGRAWDLWKRKFTR